MPEGSRRSSHRTPSNSGAKRPSSASSLSGIVGRVMSSTERGASSSCTSVNTVCSEGERPRPASLSSSASSVSLQDASHSSSSSSSSSSLPYGAVPTYNAASSSSTPKRNGSDISLDLTPLVTSPGSGANCVVKVTEEGHVMMTEAAPRQLSRLERVALEIVETEQAYVRDLKSIVEDYLGCIIECDDLQLKPEQVGALFCNIEDIYEFNSDLLEDLERSPHAAAIAECFVERSEAFDIYTLYCMNYPNSVSVLKDLMKNKVLVRFFQERQTTLNHSLPLETYLLKPVQRILKYHLLLQELSKHLEKSDPRFEVVEDAIVTMTAVAWYINDMKRKQEHAVRLQEVEALLVNWSGHDLSGFGELVLEGSFKVQRVKKERAFFLFDRMLLIAKKRLEHFVYSTHIFCCNLLLVETLKDPLCFKVSDQTIPKQQHIVQTKNQEEKRLWVHYLKRLIVENHPASLPQKARQVLGDNFCQSPHFDQDNLKMSPYASPRLDDFHGYHRGRRQSEPPELLMFTPERSRKSLPLLLDGNLPYRRSRRQSAPAKDLESAFNSNALKPAGSDSTLASSVIEVETEMEEMSVKTSVGAEEEEDDEEELNPLGPPPTLSITEEILEFINQSRAREGLAAISLTEPVRDHPEEVPPPFDFSCPLKPDVCPQTPEQAPHPEEDAMLQQETEKEVEVEKPEDESVVEADGKMLEKSEKSDEEDVGKKTPVLELHPEIVRQDNESEEEEEEVEAVDDTDIQHQQLSQRPKRDKTIIEKIRSYYEAAAEEDEGKDELDLKERASISSVPCEMVEDQDEPESGNADGKDIGPSTFLPQVSECKPVTEEKILDQEEPNVQVDLHRTVENNKDRVQNVCREFPGGKTNEEQCEQSKNRTGTSLSSPGNEAVINRHKPQLDQELSGPSSCGEPPPNVKTTQNENQNSPSQAKASRWSRHSRIVTANRALFENMRSDLTGIGLFEATPVLIENSERILSKVKTLAQMYSTKASTMTVKPCTKRVNAPKNQSWTPDRLVIQNQTQIHSVPQKITAVESPERNQVSTGWSNTNEKSPMQLNISRKETRASIQNQNQENPKTRASIQNQNQEEPKIQRERSRKKDENLTENVQESATVLPEPRKFGHVTIGDQSQQTNNRVILSRPRDFISALIKAGEELQPNPTFASSETQKTPRSEQNDRLPRYTALENPSSTSIITIPDRSQGDEECEHKQDTTTTEEQFSRDISIEPDYSVCTETASGVLGTMQNTDTQTSRMGHSLPTTGRVLTSQRELESSPAESIITSSGDNFNSLDDRNLRDEGLTPSNSAHLLQSINLLPTSTSRRTKDQTVHYTGKTDQRYLHEQSGRPFVDQSCLTDRPYSAPSAPLPSAFSIRQRPSSPLRAPPNSSPFSVIPASSPIPTLPITSFKALSGLAPPPLSDRVSSMRALPPSSPASSRRALFASPPPTHCSPSCPTPVSSSSVFNKSLAASCISQSISQSMAKNKHQAPPTGSSSPPAHLRCCPPSPKFAPMHHEHHAPPPPPWSSFHSSRPESSTNHSSISNSSSSNGMFTNSCWQQKAPLMNGNTALRQNNESHWSGSHNRVARPFPSSEPSSRVQSPTMFTQLCSPPAQNSFVANKPPCSRSFRGGNGNPLGLTLEIPRTSSSVSPHILSPPPIGVSLNIWNNNIAAPQPRNPTCPSFPSMFGSPTLETSSFVTHCTSRGSSPSRPHPAASRTLHRSFSSSLADRSSTTVPSWVDGGRRSCDQQQSCPVSPRSGWMPHLSPGLQSPPPLSRFAPERSSVGERHFNSVPWSDIRGLSNKNNDTDTTSTSYVVTSCPAPDLNASHGSQSEWEDPEPEEGSCRSQLICAYVARPLCERGAASSGRTSTSPSSFLHQSQPQAQTSSSPSPSPMYPFSNSTFSNQGSQKASYATTVNLQIAGSGRITSFSTAHVSLTQTLQGGAGSRRASLNDPSQQNGNRS